MGCAETARTGCPSRSRSILQQWFNNHFFVRVYIAEFTSNNACCDSPRSLSSFDPPIPVTFKPGPIMACTLIGVDNGHTHWCYDETVVSKLFVVIDGYGIQGTRGSRPEPPVSSCAVQSPFDVHFADVRKVVVRHITVAVRSIKLLNAVDEPSSYSCRTVLVRLDNRRRRRTNSRQQSSAGD